MDSQNTCGKLSKFLRNYVIKYVFSKYNPKEAPLTFENVRYPQTLMIGFEYNKNKENLEEFKVKERINFLVSIPNHFSTLSKIFEYRTDIAVPSWRYRLKGMITSNGKE